MIPVGMTEKKMQIGKGIFVKEEISAYEKMKLHQCSVSQAIPYFFY